MASSCSGLPHRVLLTTLRRPAVVAHWLPKQDIYAHARPFSQLQSAARPALPRDELRSSVSSPTAIATTAAPTTLGAQSSLAARLAPRIRHAARWKSSVANSEAKEAASKEPSRPSEVAAVAKSSSNGNGDEVEQVKTTLKEKVQMSEVRRLLHLARPERRTITIAIGLVR